MRTVAVSLCLVGAVLAQDGVAVSDLAAKESESREHDALGFPITFNDEVITLTDVLRSMGITDPEVLGSAREVREARDRLLRQKLVEKTAVLYGVKIPEKHLKDIISNDADSRGGEAKLYEQLMQRGQSYEEYREDIRRQLLDAYFQSMFIHGMTMTQKMLPWDLWPTPQEVRTAFERDRKRNEGVVRVAFIDFTVGLSKAERESLVVQQTFGKSDEWVAEHREKLTRPRVEKAVADLKAGIRFDLVAAKHGKLKRQPQVREQAIDNSLPGDDPRVKYLRTGELQVASPPLRTGGGEYRFYFVVARDDASSKKLDDPQVYEEYRVVIHQLRIRKVTALMRLRALDDSTIRPRRVRKELRESLLAGLRDAELELRTFGIH